MGAELKASSEVTERSCWVVWPGELFMLCQQKEETEQCRDSPVQVSA